MEIILTEHDRKRYYFLMQESRAEYLETEYESGLGNIYAGKVLKIKKSLNAAFVQIGAGSDDTGFLPLKEIPDAVVLNRDYAQDPHLKVGDTVLVQLTADEEGGKKPKLKCTLALSGRYVVVTLGRQGIGASKQIDSKRRNALLKEMKTAFKGLVDTEVFGLLLRTEAAGESVKKHMIAEEALRFVSMLDSYCVYDGEAPALLYERPHEQNVLEHLLSLLHFSQRLRLTLSDDDRRSAIRLITQNARLQHLVHESGFTYMRPEIEVCVAGNEADLTARTDKILNDCLSRKVYLDSGGVLYFDKTEALHAIDVNTSHTALKDDPKAKEGRKTLAEKISMEASDVIMRQIRMRNLSGMIFVDLPAMPKTAEARILKHLRALAEIDTVTTTVHDITALGIVEITRERAGKTLSLTV